MAHLDGWCVLSHRRPPPPRWPCPGHQRMLAPPPAGGARGAQTHSRPWRMRSLSEREQRGKKGPGQAPGPWGHPLRPPLSAEQQLALYQVLCRMQGV